MAEPMWGQRNAALDNREAYWNAANQAATLNGQSRASAGPVANEALSIQTGTPGQPA